MTEFCDIDTAENGAPTNPGKPMDAKEIRSRWRLILGRFAHPNLGEEHDANRRAMEAALDSLYSREYARRGVRRARSGREMAPGSLDPSQFNAAEWLGEVRRLFPKDVCEQLERHALERYHLTELLTDPQMLERIEPRLEVVALLMAFREHLEGAVLDQARRIIAAVVDDLRRRWKSELGMSLSGRRDRWRRSHQRVAANFDPLRTIRRNLSRYQLDKRKILASEIVFSSRRRPHRPWEIILCVDQSGSMASSIIHSAVLAGILAEVGALRVRLIVFDTQVVDLTSKIDDAVEILLSVQLGGGTDIGQALAYCEQCVTDPTRAVIVLVSDFCEGASPNQLIATCKRLSEARVKLLGLAALDTESEPVYDKEMASHLADVGMNVAALTPSKLAEWLSNIIH